jgi:divalent metal cation (Fe/Co/Zn/Cd) transporter
MPVAEAAKLFDPCLRVALSQLLAHWLDHSAAMTANANARSVDAIASAISRVLLHEEPSAKAAQNKR